MALKPDRIELLTDISFFMSTTGTRGGVVSVSTASTGVGVAMDDANAVVAVCDHGVDYALVKATANGNICGPQSQTKISTCPTAIVRAERARMARAVRRSAIAVQPVATH